MSTLIQDLRYAVRLFFQNPGFTAVAVLSLALVIGANSTIFSVINVLLLRPLEFEEADQLVYLSEVKLEQRGWQRNPTLATFHEWRKEAKSFDQLEMAVPYQNTGTSIGENGAELIENQFVSPGIFSLLGIEPQLGRTFRPDDVPYHTGEVVMISDRFWRRRFGADPAVIGQSLKEPGRTAVIVGVMPRDFWIFPWMDDVDVWVPLNLNHSLLTPESRWFSALGRLKDGVTVEQAQAEMNSIAQHFAQAHPETQEGWGINVETLHESYFRGAKRTLFLLLGAVGFVLLIGCTNVANMQLSRAVTRQKEVAIRTSLGAGRLRLIRQLLIESMLLALAGGALGIIVTVWGIQLFVALAPGWFPMIDKISIDGRVLAFTLVVSLLAGVLFGLFPALQASKTNLTESLKEGERRSSGGRGYRLRALLVVSEVALALVLLIGAGLMINTYLRLERIDPGFNPENLLMIDLKLAGEKYWESREGDIKSVTPQVELFYQQLLEGIGRIPGIESVGICSPVSMYSFRVEGSAPVKTDQMPRAVFCEVNPDYFGTLEIPLLKGRTITEQDIEGTPWVAVINQSMVQRHFPNEEPVGKRIHLTFAGAADLNMEEGHPREVVGVVGNVRQWGLRWDPEPAVYVSFRQHIWDYPNGAFEPHVSKQVIMRSVSDQLQLASAVREVFLGIDRDQVVNDIQTMKGYLSDSIGFWYFWVRLLGIFAGLAVVLVVVGIYGVMAYSVRQRTHEVGVRMALGASRWDVLRLVIWQGLKLTAIGLLIGIGASFWLTRFISSYLYGVTPTDPLTLVLVCGVLVAVAMIACYIPGRWATKVNPLTALRYE